MILEYEGKRPRIGNNVFIAPTAVIIGDVEIGEGASIWFGAVLRGDEGSIIIGAGSNVQDNAVLHTTPWSPTRLAENVTVGHAACLEGCDIGSATVVGMGAIILEKAVIGESVMIAAGCVITPGTIVPARTLVAGVPGVVKRELDSASIEGLRFNSSSYHHLRERYLQHQYPIGMEQRLDPVEGSPTHTDRD
ncbi:MAG: gamma carbonic anhydrase family protein [Blastocatellia bacterium]